MTSLFIVETKNAPPDLIIGTFGEYLGHRGPHPSKVKFYPLND